METLTKRELQIADLIHQGYIEKEIADKLFLSPGTVHTHKKRLCSKLNARNIADVTRIYITKLQPELAVMIITLAILAYCHLRGIDICEAVKTCIKSIRHGF